VTVTNTKLLMLRHQGVVHICWLSHASTSCNAAPVPGDRFPAHIHADARWAQGGIGRFSREVLPRVLGGGRLLGGRFRHSRPQGAMQMAAQFTPLAARGGLLFSPGFVPPMLWERRTIATVHDLHYLDPLIPAHRHQWYFRRVVVPQIRRCRLVLTVSEHSATELRELLDGRGPEVVIVGNGVDRVFLDTPASAPSSVPRLVFVGGDKTNKNLPAALRAFSIVARRCPVELVVIGEVAKPLLASAPPGVSFVGTIDDTSLAALYASSTALLMPSLAEGFGLPALEALVTGTPVVFGDRCALPEVVGDSGWAVDPLDDQSIAAGIESAISSPIVVSPARREALAAAHRWEEVARRVVAAVEGVL
jgi:glycosyltransferase involved in cell wall biosynthesis